MIPSVVAALVATQPSTQQAPQLDDICVLDCGTGKSSLYHFSNSQPRFGMKDMATLDSLKGMFAPWTQQQQQQQQKGLFDLIEHTMKDASTSILIVGLTSWYRTAGSAEKAALTRAFHQRFPTVQIVELTIDQEGQFEKRSILYAAQAADLPMPSIIVAAGGGSFQLHRKDAFFPIELGFRATQGALMDMKDHESLEEIVAIHKADVTRAFNGILEHNPGFAHEAVAAVGISATFYAAKAIRMDKPEGVLVKDLLVAMVARLASLVATFARDKKVPTKEAQEIANLTMLVPFFQKLVHPDTRVFFRRNWTIDNKPFVTTWSSGFYIEYLEHLAHLNYLQQQTPPQQESPLPAVPDPSRQSSSVDNVDEDGGTQDSLGSDNGLGTQARRELERANDAKVNWANNQGSALQVMKDAWLSMDEPHWSFQKGRHGDVAFVHMSCAESDRTEKGLRAFIANNEGRTMFLKGGQTGYDLYLVIFWPLPSDGELLASLQDRTNWTPADHARHQEAMQSALLSKGTPDHKCLYVKVCAIKGPTSGPARIFVRKPLDAETKAVLQDFPLASLKDIQKEEQQGMTRPMIRDLGLFGHEAVRDHVLQTTTTLPRVEFTTPVFVWLHKHGWRVIDKTSNDVLVKNMRACMASRGDVDVFTQTGKSIKKTSFRPIDPTAYMANIVGSNEMANVPIDPTKQYFLQGNAAWSLGNKTVNWRPVMCVEEADLTMQQRQQFRLSCMFPRLSVYEIQSIWAKHRYCVVPGTDPADAAAMAALKARVMGNLSTIRQSLPPTQRHSLLDEIEEIMQKPESVMSLVYSIVNNVLICTIGLCRLVDPVVVSSGHTFERTALHQWVQSHGKNPMTNQRLRVSDIQDDAITLKLIALFKNL